MRILQHVGMGSGTGQKGGRKAGFYRDLMTKSWREFAIGSDELGPIATAALKAVRVPEGAIATPGKAGGLAGRIAGRPLRTV
jgi:hypothetical protein